MCNFQNEHMKKSVQTKDLTVFRVYSGRMEGTKRRQGKEKIRSNAGRVATSVNAAGTVCSITTAAALARLDVHDFFGPVLAAKI